MKKKPFADLELSLLGMGNMRLPVRADGKIDREKAQAIIDLAYKSGINYFDTAFRYHGGESELFIGEALKKYPRDSWCLASKLPGHMMHVDADGRLGFHGYLSDFHCDSIGDIFEEQLKKCQVDWFDFYLLHNLNENSYDFYTDPRVGAVEYLLKQKEAGRIRHLGFSSHGSAETIDKFLTLHPGVFEFVQIQLNYLDWTLQDARTKYDVIVKHGLKVVVMEPMRGGKLANLPADAEAILQIVSPERTPASWAFRFLQELPGVQVVLSGMTTLEQLEENIALFSVDDPLSEAEHAALDRAVERLLNAIPCTACRYCTEECPQKLEIPKIIEEYNRMQNERVEWPTDDEAMDPARCIGCGVCAQVCPQGIQVPEIMRKIVEGKE